MKIDQNKPVPQEKLLRAKSELQKNEKAEEHKITSEQEKRALEWLKQFTDVPVTALKDKSSLTSDSKDINKEEKESDELRKEKALNERVNYLRENLNKFCFMGKSNRVKSTAPHAKEEINKAGEEEGKEAGEKEKIKPDSALEKSALLNSSSGENIKNDFASAFKGIMSKRFEEKAKEEKSGFKNGEKSHKLNDSLKKFLTEDSDKLTGEKKPAISIFKLQGVSKEGKQNSFIDFQTEDFEYKKLRSSRRPSLSISPPGKKPSEELISPQEKISREDRPDKRQREIGKEILSQLRGNERIWNIYQRLKPEEKRKFMSLAIKLYTPGNDGNSSGSVEPALLSLLSDNKLFDRDSEGTTLLDNLSLMAGQEFAEGLEGNNILRETIRNTGDPERIHQGYGEQGKGTCTVTTMEYMNAAQYGSEYVRIISGLTGREGRVQLRNGDMMERDEDTINDDGSNRSPVSRIYQASMMEYANGILNYNNLSDRHSDGTGGLNVSQLNRALNAILPYESTSRRYRAGMRDIAEREIMEALRQGRFVPVGLEWGGDDGTPGGHKLLLERIEGDFVYLRNPWGSEERGDRRGDEPEREVVGRGGHIRMTVEEFFRRLRNYNLPSSARETDDNSYEELRLMNSNREAMKNILLNILAESMKAEKERNKYFSNLMDQLNKLQGEIFSGREAAMAYVNNAGRSAVLGE